MLKKYINKIIYFFTLEKYSEIYHISGTWTVKYNDINTSVDEYCGFTILKSNKNNYQLKTYGYKPKEHNLYSEVFRIYRCLIEETYEIRGNKIFKIDKKDEDLTIEECNEKLKKAIEDEDYELAKKIKILIKNKESL